MRIRSVFPFAAALVAAVSLELPGSVLAAPASHPIGGVAGAPAPATGHFKPPTVKSATFAGYEYQGGGEGNWEVAARITVPKVKCKAKGEQAINPSVGVYGSTSFSSAGLFVGCLKRKPLYFLTLVVNGKDHNYTKLAVKPGDTVSVRVSQSPTSVVVSAVDKSRKGVKKTLKGTGSAAGSAPWVGDADWNNPGELPVPDFGTVKFSKAKLDGKPFGISAGESLARYVRVKGSTKQIATGTLAKHESFATVFKHS